MDLMTLGEALVCLAPPVASLATSSVLQRGLGGAELNTAIGLARLGRQVAFVSRVADDPFGDLVVRTLQDEGVATAAVRRVSGRTGVMFKDRPNVHESQVFYYRDGSAASEIDFTDVDEAMVRASRMVHVTGITAVLGQSPLLAVTHLLATCVAVGTPVSFDPNFRPQLLGASRASALFRELLGSVDQLLCNEREASLITGETEVRAALVSLKALGPRNVVIKRGRRGAIALVDDALWSVPAWPADAPVDSVGAGDAFNAGWLHAQLGGLPPEEALPLAAFVAAQVVQHHGDYEGFPSAPEVEMSQQRPLVQASNVSLPPHSRRI
jgi:2-dehydro-3-deoxygluconokinase